jgi:hypothetical protein
MIAILLVSGLGYDHRQYALVPTALDVPVLDIGVELEGANEPAIGSLAQVGRDLVALPQLPLALDGQDLPLDQNPDLVGFDPGQIHLDDEGIFVFANIDGRIPAHGAPGPVNELVEYRVDIMMVKIQTPAFHHAVPPVNQDPAIAVV